MSDLVVNVRQISNYPAQSASDGTENLLVQSGGLGGPYQSIGAKQLVATALSQSGPMSVGVPIPASGVNPASIFTEALVLPVGGDIQWNFPENTAFGYELSSGFAWWVNDSAQMGLSNAGNLVLPFGTLTVARDPANPNEVATMGWVGRNTVASFNNRIGKVTLTAADVYAALCLCDPIATQPWVIQAINAGIQNLLTTCPFVTTWNGRKGNVYLTLADITCVFYQPGQQPISPTPALTSNDDSIATTKWVTEWVTNELAGSGGIIATQSWVLANTVNSFNGRVGPVTLTGADVFDVGAASLNSPNFSGIPTAPTAAVGQASGQIATTAFVQQAISANTAGVSTFNTRSGDVVLNNADIVAAGGLTNPSPNLTGAPTAPTAAPGTSTPQIANTQFVMTALAASVTSFNTRTGAVTLQLTDITGAGGAPLVSPNFSSVPTAPTAAPGTNTVQLATCAFVTQALATAGGVSSFNGRTGAVDLIPNDISGAGGLVNPSVTLTGTPTAPTATMGTNTQQIATCAFVETAISSGSVLSFNTRQGAVVLTAADITGAGGAVLASPAFTGAPTAPTAPAATNNTQIASTAFVQAAIANNTATVTSWNTRTGAVTMTTADIIAAGGAPLASPSFTGTPLGPTATAGTNTTQLATTQFVQSAIASSGVASFNGRTGAVTLIANDVSAAGGALLASPTFTGTPAAPTATVGTNTTQLATTAYVLAAMVQPATAAPLMAGAAAVGSSLLYARQDHVHPTDTSRAAASALAGYLPLSGGTLTGGLNISTGGLTVSGANNVVNITGADSALFAVNVGNGALPIGWVVTNGLSVNGNATANQLFVNGGGYSTHLGGTLVNGTIIPNNDNTSWCGLPGNAWYGVASFNFAQQSDPRLKKDVTTAPGSLAQVLAIPVRTYRYLAEPETGPLHWGWLSTEVHAGMGDDFAGRMVGEDAAKTESLSVYDMVAVLWAAVQELAARLGMSAAPEAVA